jgi:hypothetical protein
MIELSLTDILFIAWGGIASALACHFYAKERAHNIFVQALIENQTLRGEFFHRVDSMKEKEA